MEFLYVLAVTLNTVQSDSQSCPEYQTRSINLANVLITDEVNRCVFTLVRLCYPSEACFFLHIFLEHTSFFEVHFNCFAWTDDNEATVIKHKH